MEGKRKSNHLEYIQSSLFSVTKPTLKPNYSTRAQPIWVLPNNNPGGGREIPTPAPSALPTSPVGGRAVEKYL